MKYIDKIIIIPWKIINIVTIDNDSKIEYESFKVINDKGKIEIKIKYKEL
jgi:hypothetical protein